MSLSDRMREPFVSFGLAFAGTPEERCVAATEAWRQERDRRLRAEAQLAEMRLARAGKGRRL